MRNPKEFYIVAKHKWYGDSYECHAEVPNTKNCHVIEYSAYEQLRDENTRIEQYYLKLNKKDQETIRNLKALNDGLVDKVSVLGAELDKLKQELEDKKLDFKSVDELISKLEAENTELVDSARIKNVVKRTSEITQLREQVKDYEQALNSIAHKHADVIGFDGTADGDETFGIAIDSLDKWRGV